MGKQSKEPQWSRNKADFPLPPKPSITKEEGPRTKAGGASKNAAYNGPCCGGTRKVGDFGRYTDPASGTKFYACGSCRKPLALTDEQRTRIAASKEAAIDKQMLAAAAKAECEYLLAHGQDEDVLVCPLAL